MPSIITAPTTGPSIRPIYGRFESLVIKLFELEEDASIYLLLDCSRSMESKFLYARKLAATSWAILHSRRPRSAGRLQHGRLAGAARRALPRRTANTLRFLRSLEDAKVFGRDTQFTSCARVFQARRHRRGLVIVLSDFLFPQGFEEGLHYLQFHRHEVYCLQIQDENDTQCHLKGDIELECVESGQRKRVTITPREARRYQQAVADWNESLKTCCVSCGIGLASTSTRPPFESVIEDMLRRGGLVA